MLNEIRVAFAVSCDETLDDAEASAVRIFVFAIASAFAVGDDSFDVPVAGIEKKADEGLFIIGIAAGIGFDHDAEAIGGEGLRKEKNEQEENEIRK